VLIIISIFVEFLTATNLKVRFRSVSNSVMIIHNSFASFDNAY
jgi:hypothetical protein